MNPERYVITVIALFSDFNIELIRFDKELQN